jgi:hypothetical protein
MRHIKTAGEVIDALGGNTMAGRTLGETAATVGNWRMRGRIPAEYYLRITKIFDAMGIKISGDVFAMKAVA